MANPGLQSVPIPTLLIVEDGDEYLEFFERNLRGFRLLQAHAYAEVIDALKRNHVNALVMDIRFDRNERDTLVGDVLEISRRRYGQDTDLTQAWQYMADNQGFLISRKLRSEGRPEPLLFIEQLPERQVTNLKRLYDPVAVVPDFDPIQIQRTLIALIQADMADQS